MNEQSMECHVLVTSISRKIPLIQSVRKAIKKIPGRGIIHGGDIDNKCIGKFFSDHFWEMPPIEKLTVKQLISYCHLHDITIIIPTRDKELPFFARWASRLREQNIEVMISPPDCIDLCVDKLRFGSLKWNRGPCRIIPTYSSAEELEATGLVVKERFGSGSRSILINVDQMKAIQQAKSMVEPVFQPFIAGNEFSIDVFITKGGNIKGCIVRKRDLVVNGESQVTTTVRHNILENGVADLCKELGMRGHVVLQSIEDSQGNCHIIECNCRFGGASTLSISAGLDTFYWFLLESLGQDLTDYPFCRTNKELRQIRFPQDMVIYDTSF